jgi:acyl carrier protein
MEMKMSETKGKIRNYIAENLLFSQNGYGFPDEASFLEEGIVDSMGVMELVAFIEEKFEITVEDHEITPENFDSVERLDAYIQKKQAA